MKETAIAATMAAMPMVQRLFGHRQYRQNRAREAGETRPPFRMVRVNTPVITAKR